MSKYVSVDSMISQGAVEEYGREVAFERALIMARAALTKHMYDKFGEQSPEHVERVMYTPRKPMECTDNCHFRALAHTHQTIYWDRPA